MNIEHFGGFRLNLRFHIAFIYLYKVVTSVLLSVCSEDHKNGYEIAPEPYRAVVNDNKSYDKKILKRFLGKGTSLNICLLIPSVVVLCHYGNPSEKDK